MNKCYIRIFHLIFLFNINHCIIFIGLQYLLQIHYNNTDTVCPFLSSNMHAMVTGGLVYSINEKGNRYDSTVNNTIAIIIIRMYYYHSRVLSSSRLACNSRRTRRPGWSDPFPAPSGSPWPL